MYNYLYKTTNNINGKYYIGMRSTNNDPWLDPYLGSGKALKEAIKKYGKENFNKEILSFHSSRRELEQFEILFITNEIVNDINSYNMRCGGWGNQPGENSPLFGTKASKNTRLKMSISRSGTNNPMSGKSHTSITKQKISNSKKGKCLSEEHKLKIGASNMGKMLSEDHIRKLSIANKKEKNPMFGNPLSFEHKKKISNANKGRVLTEEHKLKLSISNKGKKHFRKKKKDNI